MIWIFFELINSGGVLMYITLIMFAVTAAEALAILLVWEIWRRRKK